MSKQNKTSLWGDVRKVTYAVSSGTAKVAEKLPGTVVETLAVVDTTVQGLGFMAKGFKAEQELALLEKQIEIEARKEALVSNPKPKTEPKSEPKSFNGLGEDLGENPTNDDLKA